MIRRCVFSALESAHKMCNTGRVQGGFRDEEYYIADG